MTLGSGASRARFGWDLKSAWYRDDLKTDSPLTINSCMQKCDEPIPWRDKDHEKTCTAVVQEACVAQQVQAWCRFRRPARADVDV